MKRLISLLILLSIGTAPLFAGWRNAMIRLKHEMGRSISVTIDGRKYNKIGRTLNVSDLPPGNHRIKIYRYNNNGYGYGQGILIYQGNVNLRPGRIYYMIVSKDGLDIEENCCIDDYGHWNQNDNWDWDDPYTDVPNDDPSNNWNNNRRWEDDRNNDRFTENSWDAYQGLMSEGRFNQLLDQVRKASFESAKLSVVRQAMKHNRINCSQLLRILNELSFESTKLEFAKEAYNSVVDRNNYFMVNDAFTFQSSKDELLEHINRSGR